MNTTDKQQGVALITALLVVSLATVLAVSLVNHLYFDIRRTENILRLDQAQLYNSGAVNIVMEGLEMDRNSRNEYDSLDEIREFNESFVYEVEGGFVTAKLTDLQSCFNLNNLSKTNTELAKYRSQYIALLVALGIDNSQHAILTDSLVDWLDNDDITEPQGAEFDYYIGLDKPYRTANNLMNSPSELRLVKGYTEKIIQQIKDEVCVLPEVNTAININTASGLMLESIKDLQGHGEQIIKYRDGNPEIANGNDSIPFEKLEEFTKYVSDTLKIKKFDAKGLQTYSEYFLLESKAQLGAGDIRLYSVIKRNQDNASTKLIRQTGGAY